MVGILGVQLAAIRADSGQTLTSLATASSLDRGTLALLETGGGTLAAMTKAATTLGYEPEPHPLSLKNKRRWLGMSERVTARAAGVTLPTLQSFEKTGAGRVSTFEGMFRALDEKPTLAKIEQTWFTPAPLVSSILTALKLKRFDLDPCSPPEPTTSRRLYRHSSFGG